MLDIHRLREQFTGFDAYQAQKWEAEERKLRHALTALEECSPGWEMLRDAVAGRKLPWLVAGLREAPGHAFQCGPRPTPVTVVATDGSQIYPDRHFEPTCYLLNISRIAFQYGTFERPLMESVPSFRYRNNDLEGYADEVIEAATVEVISSMRDKYELEALFETASGVRISGRPILAMADGTLIRWPVGAIQDRTLRDQLIADYTAVLSQFERENIPVCSYISMPGGTEVVNLLRVHAGECEEERVEETLAGLTDRRLFEHTLRPGERSAVFESASHILREYGPANWICYFYVHVGSGSGSSAEVARVEIPRWVADQPGLLEMIHAIVLNECEKGNGYPMILSEAHEQAVIRAQERELFYQLVENQLNTAGLPALGSRKQLSKRRPAV